MKRISRDIVSPRPLLAIGFLVAACFVGRYQPVLAQTESPGQPPAPTQAPPPPRISRGKLGVITESSIRAHMEALASDAMRGRGSGTADEFAAAQYVAAQLKSYGIEPAGDQIGSQRDYIESVTVRKTTLIAPYALTFTDPRAARTPEPAPRPAPKPVPAAPTRGKRARKPVKPKSKPVVPAAKKSNETHLAYGKDFVVAQARQASTAGPLQKIDVDADLGAIQILPGALVFMVHAPDPLDARPVTPAGISSAVAEATLRSLRRQITALSQKGATTILYVESADRRKRWKTAAERLPSLPPGLTGSTPGGLTPDEISTARPALVGLTPEAAARLARLPQGTVVRLDAKANPPVEGKTWNALGILRGSDSTLGAILLSAHIDHLGLGKPVKGDAIYNGADDDASGVTAVLELAESLAAHKTPKRTILFAFFGSEELGGYGATYFRERPPVPLDNIAADLEFEMIGRADPAIRRTELWLSGYERSNLGPELAKHGAKLVPDPHPAENFFMRSDNYTLALRGVVAHTVSSFGLHHDYHQPSDDLSQIDFSHMTESIQSMSKPIEWLANSNFKPAWKPGQQPGAKDFR